MNAPQKPQQAVFVSGSTLRHVAVMTTTASVGLVAIFVVDFLSLLYVSRLGRPEATAGVGYATIVLYLMVSINVGLMIAVAALTARALGAGDREGARRMAGSTLTAMTICGLAVSLLMLPLLPWLLPKLGAHGESLAVATSFLWITLPSNALMALGMGLSGILRAVGDAKRAMYVTLAGGIVTAGLDPMLIFGLGLGPDGAAWATVFSRIVFLVIGFQSVIGVHKMIARPSLAALRRDVGPTFAIAAPAILTNLANPIANACFFGIIARFGDQAIAASAIIDRLVPVAFGVLFALSGAVGPILAQNWGAQRYDRMRRALTDAFGFAAAYVAVVAVLLALLRHQIAALFGTGGETAELVAFFCLIAGPMWLFVGALFVANAAFNNLGMPFYSTLFSWGRATLGTVPLAWLGAQYAGPKGALAGAALGAVLFGIIALVAAYRGIARLEGAAQAAARSSLA
ncbi:MATE family efflux transporter [Bosea sp. 62]|uniref:MATE family efflux transporter n=1 Tax=unclassified Bosea (in: a-proteobacteria) TaxID=2653178 RepID=UPI0012597946|nr:MULTISPECIES: MATE family efflux transporter [unclassified Bosea (in: a-proteobacteria)]CAD5294025.1 MATE family efflux transporter [Bosea sp. 7B]CAD5298119.1 MATE family efflux transporter [Bosea sp. 21B]CAD5298297.1 MATE family efflux transporter [Bosea sp. 46]VVT61407.1 MATE family efflux transporter [Bosea sp. EC-HK365B]VXB16227.1 MATE family efflux transporter [Bosea sp. 127]